VIVVAVKGEDMGISLGEDCVFILWERENRSNDIYICREISGT